MQTCVGDYRKLNITNPTLKSFLVFLDAVKMHGYLTCIKYSVNLRENATHIYTRMLSNWNFINSCTYVTYLYITIFYICDQI